MPRPDHPRPLAALAGAPARPATVAAYPCRLGRLGRLRLGRLGHLRLAALAGAGAGAAYLRCL
ncbi:MAG: hypothetical protein KBF43_14685 [Dermatophilaceae bacterium]|nr:hypothetical protein [Dermatophilaceae bacterium]